MAEQATPEDIQTLFAGNPASLRKFLETAHPVDVAGYLDRLEAPEAKKFLLKLTPEDQGRVFGYLRPETQVALAESLGRRPMADILTAMSADDRADVFNRLEKGQRDLLLPGLAQAEREDLRRLASYEEGTAGAIMTSSYATLNPEHTARDAIKTLRLQAPDKETIYRAFVLDEGGSLIGAVRLQDVILARPNTKIKNIMDKDPLAARLTDTQESVAQTLSRYDMLAVPVVDDRGVLYGIVTYDDALDALEEEATEDLHKFGTVGKISASVKDAGFWLMYRKRIGWLVLLVFGNLFSSAGIALYEETIAAYVALVFFLPLLIGSGGNAGAQAATLMVRALATGDVVMRDWARMSGRELLVGTALAVTMALAVTPISLARGSYDIAMVVGITMMIVVVVGSLVGMSLPFILNKLRLDPAAASAPLVTTVCDVIGVVSYFGVASIVLF